MKNVKDFFFAFYTLTNEHDPLSSVLSDDVKHEHVLYFFPRYYLQIIAFRTV